MITVITPTIRGEAGLKRPKESLAKQTYTDFEWLIEEHKPTDPPDFNQAMNRMLRKAKGELVVILQDYISIPEDGLEAFWAEYILQPDAFWTAPIGKIRGDSWVEWDWRKARKHGEECSPLEWEIDWGAAPLAALKKIGGFDEELDKYWGFDNVNIGIRAEMAGYKIRCLPFNCAIAEDHRVFEEHPYQNLRNPDFHNERLRDIQMGRVEVNYL